MTIRFAPEEMAAVSAVAASVNVSVGALVRECAVRYAPTVAREVSRGDLRLRRASAVEAVKGQVVPARSLVVESVAMAHQRRLNEMKERAQRGGKK